MSKVEGKKCVQELLEKGKELLKKGKKRFC